MPIYYLNKETNVHNDIYTMRQFSESGELIALLIFSSFILLIIIICICVGAKVYNQYKLNKLNDFEYNILVDPYKIAENFFELIISCVTILLAIYIYYYLDSYFKVFVLWNNFSSFVLLLLICGSVILNNLIDNKLMQNLIEDNDKADLRLLSSLYIVAILLFFKKKFETVSYDKLILLYCSLVLGRFIYFDFIIKQFWYTILSIIKRIYLLILLIFYTYIIASQQIAIDIFSKANVLFYLLLLHLFMLFAAYMSKRILWKIL